MHLRRQFQPVKKRFSDQKKILHNKSPYVSAYINFNAAGRRSQRAENPQYCEYTTNQFPSTKIGVGSDVLGDNFRH